MSRTVLTGLLLGTICSVSAWADSASETLDKARTAEANGDLNARKELLAAALEAAPNDAAVRWQNGFVKLGAKWVKAEDVYRVAPGKAALEDYRDLRKKSTPTLESQLKLADFCKSRGLKEQERAHLSAVVELDPDHAAARQRLGHQQVDGSWQSKEEIEAARVAAKKTAEAMRKHRGELLGLRQGLERGTLTQAAAVERLTQHKEAAVIPAWELYVSSESAPGSEAVVAALGEMTEDEASLSLARHALYSPYPAVSAAAANALQSRNRHSFVPSLLAALKSRWMTSTQTLRPEADRIVVRYTMFADGADKQQLATFEDVFFMSGWLPDAAAKTAVAANQNQRSVEQRRAEENRRAEAANAKIMDLLKTVTGETTADSPQAWWQWWCDENGVYFEGDKPLEQTYAANYPSIVGQTPLPPTGSGGPPTSGSPPRTRHECLAGGTPVWTDQGPVAVDRVKMGDLVLALNTKSGELAYKLVLRITVRPPEKLYCIEFEKEVLRASAGHPFWVAGKGWTIARDLEPKMVLTGNPEPLIIKQVSEEEKPVKSFNLVVDGFHTYFAGSAPVLSHDNSVREVKAIAAQ